MRRMIHTIYQELVILKRYNFTIKKMLMKKLNKLVYGFIKFLIKDDKKINK